MPNPDRASERRAFEAKVKAREFRHLDHFDLLMMESGDMYIHMPAEMAWQGWLARSAVPTVVSEEMVEAGARGLAGLDNVWMDMPPSVWSEYRIDARACLTAALTVSPQQVMPAADKPAQPL